MRNTSVTDTETQFQMSSDSGSRVQLTEASKQATAAKIIPESQVNDEDILNVWLTQSIPTGSQTQASEIS